MRWPFSNKKNDPEKNLPVSVDSQGISDGGFEELIQSIPRSGENGLSENELFVELLSGVYNAQDRKSRRKTIISIGPKGALCLDLERGLFIEQDFDLSRFQNFRSINPTELQTILNDTYMLGVNKEIDLGECFRRIALWLDLK